MVKYIKFNEFDEERENTITFELAMGGYYIFNFDYGKLWGYIDDYYCKKGILLVDNAEKLSAKTIKILKNLIDERISQVVEYNYRLDNEYTNFEEEYVVENKSKKEILEKVTDRSYIHSLFYIAKKKMLITDEEIKEFKKFILGSYKGKYEEFADIYMDRLIYLMIRARIIYIQKCFPILNSKIEDIEKYVFEQIKIGHTIE